MVLHGAFIVKKMIWLEDKSLNLNYLNDLEKNVAERLGKILHI